MSGFRRYGVAAALVMAAGSAQAQVTSGNIAGVVKDPTGAVVPNASISIKSESTGVVVDTKTNNAGEYLVQNLLPASYDITVNATGFSTSVLKAVPVTLNKTSTSDLTVGVASSSSVEVEASSGTTLDTTTNNLTTTFEAEELAVLPTATVGFGVLNASLLAPNVASPGGSGIGTGPSVGGQRPRNNNYTIEGIDDNDKSVTGPLITIPNDAVGDFTLITSQFSPEFGHSSGGQFNTSVISGTNHYHGRLYEYFQNRNLNAASGPAGGKTPNTRYDFNRYGGQLGGPLVHNKLFAFGNFERSTTGSALQTYICTPTAAGRQQLQSLAGTYGLSATNLQQYLLYTPEANVGGGAQVGTDVPDNACFDVTAPGGGSAAQYLTVSTDGLGTNPVQIPLGNAFVTPPSFSNSDQATFSVDFTPSQKDNFRFRYTYFTSGAIDTTNSLSAFFQNLPVREHLGTVSWFHNFTSNLINEARVGYNRYYNSYPATPLTYPGLSQFPNLILFDAGIDIGGNDNAPQFGLQNLYQLVDNVSYVRGHHTFRFGFDGRKYISPQNFIQRQRGDYEYSGLDVFLHDLAPDEFGERSAGAENYAGDQTAFYGYGNDTYRATDKLTLNFGLRYEFTSVPAGERRQALNSLASVPGLIDFHAPQPTYTALAPRLGVAYAVDEKTSIRAGFGLAYDVLFDNLGLLSSPPQLSQTHDVGNVAGGDPDVLSPNFLANGGLSNTLVPITDPATARAETAAYLPNQILPYSENYNLTVQRVFAKNYTVEVQYLGTRGIHLPVQNQTNVTPIVTAANQLTTFFSGATLVTPASGSAYGLIATPTNVNTYASQTASAPYGYFLPSFYNAGFLSKITSYQPYGGSNYNGLGFNVTRRYTNGLQMNASYTWSRAMDDSTAEVNASALTERRPQDSRNQHAEYSRSALDRTQRLSVEAVYDVPFFRHSNFLMRNLVGNWQLSPIYTYETPEYVTATSNVSQGSNRNGDAGAISRTVINPNGNKQLGSGVVPVYSTTLAGLCTAGSTRCNANLVGYQAVNPNAYYVTAGSGTLPNQERNTLASRPIDNVTLTAGKRIAFSDRYAFEFQAEAFNLLNHAQYVPGNIDSIGGTSTTSANTAIINYLNPAQPNFNRPETVFNNHPRSMQLSAKFNF